MVWTRRLDTTIPMRISSMTSSKEPQTETTQSPPTARSWHDVVDSGKRSDVPEGLWMRCPECKAMMYRKNVEQNLHVCPECDDHYRINADQRAQQLCDEGSFEPMWESLGSVDALKFFDLKSYQERLASEQEKTRHKDALLCGKGFIKGRGVVLACMDNRFMMGSMGSVVGEKIARCIDLAMETDRPLVVVSCSGGARMQESTLSLMQMAKTAAGLAAFDEAGGLFISVLTDPTTGGVTASFAMLGDVILAEPKALIGFAGPRGDRQHRPPGTPGGVSTQRAPSRKRVYRPRGPPQRPAQRDQPPDRLRREVDVPRTISWTYHVMERTVQRKNPEPDLILMTARISAFTAMGGPAGFMGNREANRI